ncbi:SGNH/GDSL hydrolase family protein [Candidatus Daviesbacteria bacterium]|nr:SGNH/GDSL hydrolase family protein [Candidatus Daviesbacteria bacterium]
MSVKKIALLILGILVILISIYSYKLLNKNKPLDYTLVFVGDSMTEYLGNFDELRNYLKKYYPNKNYTLLNYGFSSTNILSVPDRMEKLTDRAGRGFRPINDITFDLIFIESFGYNPLSQFSLADGLKKQKETLDQIINIIIQKHPKASIVFIATIAPNKEVFGGGVLNLLPDQKKQWVSERIAYIKNHIEYAKSHNIPLINIYQNSLNEKGDGNIDYINSTDFIHPSPTGIYFISKQIADFILCENTPPLAGDKRTKELVPPFAGYPTACSGEGFIYSR